MSTTYAKSTRGVSSYLHGNSGTGVENQAYVVAPAQWGQKADGRRTYGRSMVVNPWGTVLSTCPDRDGFAFATIDLDYLDRFRTEFPALKDRRPEAYDW